MRVLQIYAYGARLDLDPGDCARLAELCDLGEDKYITPEDEPAAVAARTYAALFRSLALGGVALNNLAPGDGYRDTGRDLAELGLADLLRPLPGDRAAQEGAQ